MLGLLWRKGAALRPENPPREAAVVASIHRKWHAWEHDSSKWLQIFELRLAICVRNHWNPGELLDQGPSDGSFCPTLQDAICRQRCPDKRQNSARGAE